MRNPLEQLKKIAFEIWDEDFFGDGDFLGECSIFFNDIGKGPHELDPQRKWVEIDAMLQGNEIKGKRILKARGSVKVRVFWEPFLDRYGDGPGQKEISRDAAREKFLDWSVRAFISIQPQPIQTHRAQALPVETCQICLYRCGLYRFKDP